MPTVTLQPTAMTGWVSGTRHYRSDDGHDYAVIVDDGLPDEIAEQIQPVLDILLAEDAGDGNYQPPVEPKRRPKFPRDEVLIELQPTAIVECNPNGTAITLTPAWTFPPTTSHEDALQQAGFTIT